MQFTTSLVSLFLAAASVQAFPGSSLAERQTTPLIYAKFYSDNGCDGTWVEDTVWVQASTQTCTDFSIPESYGSVLIAQNSATQTLRAYSGAGCTGNYFDVPKTVTQCYAQHVGSVIFHD